MAAKPPKTPMPELFVCTPEHRAFAAEHGLDLMYNIDRFRFYHAKKGSQFVRWDKAFSNWLKKAVQIKSDNAKFNASRGASNGQSKQSTANDRAEYTYSRITPADF